MNRDPKQEFDGLFPKLELWQQQWVACRAAMRVLPAVCKFAGGSYWNDSATSVDKIARLPWLISLLKLVPSPSSKFKEICETVYSAHKRAKLLDEAAVAGATFAAHAVDGGGAYSEHVKHAANAARVSVLRATDSMSIPFDVYTSALVDANSIRTWQDRPYLEPTEECWQDFFGRRLWEPLERWPDGWADVVDAFRKTITDFGYGELADRYEEHCDNGADFEDVQRWLFGEVRIPLQKDDTQLPHDDEWWMLLLYRIGLEDRGRLNVLVQPRMDDVEAALLESVQRSENETARAKAASKEPSHSESNIEGIGIEFVVGRWLKRKEIATVAERLEKQFGHLSPPPLWTAWFQAVHGDELRKIREHFARESV